MYLPDSAGIQFLAVLDTSIGELRGGIHVFGQETDVSGQMMHLFGSHLYSMDFADTVSVPPIFDTRRSCDVPKQNGEKEPVSRRQGSVGDS